MSKHNWAILAVSLLLSPGCMVVQLGVTNPIPELSTVAVAPFLNLSQEPNMVVDGRRFALAYQAELQKVPGFEVIPVGVTETTIIDLDLQLTDAHDIGKLAEELGADVIVIGTITDYDPYYPSRLGMTVEWFARDVDCKLYNVPLDPQARGEIIKSDLLFRKDIFKAKWEKRYHHVREAIRKRPLEQMKVEGIEKPVTIQPEKFREVPNLFRGQSPTYPLSPVRIQTGIDRPSSYTPNTGLQLWPVSSGDGKVRQPVELDRPSVIPQRPRPFIPETKQFPYGYSAYRIDSQSQKKTTSFEKIQNPIMVSSQGRFELTPNKTAESSTKKSVSPRDTPVSRQRPIPVIPEPALSEDTSGQNAPSSNLQTPPLPSEFPQLPPHTNSVPHDTMHDHTLQKDDLAEFKPLMTYTRLFDASDSDLLAEWRDYLELSGDRRYGDWVTKLSWSENFLRFTARLMIREMLIVHGGEARRTIIFKLRKHR